MSVQLTATPLPVETRQRTRSWRWDVVQALHDKDAPMTDVELSEATGGDIGAIRRAIQGLAQGGVLRVTEVSGDPQVAMVCQLTAL
jgi:hypothetical protein